MQKIVTKPPYMEHKGCGGEIKEDWRKLYEYEGRMHPAYKCAKCFVEILGDAQIHLPGVDV